MSTDKPLPEAVREQIHSLARDIGTVEAVARRRSDPTADDTLMIARLEQWQRALWDIKAGVQACAEAAAQARARLRDEAKAIYRGFENESLNGVVCSIPDTGIYTQPHRTWCHRCQQRYLRLYALAFDDAVASHPPPTPEDR